MHALPGEQLPGRKAAVFRCVSRQLPVRQEVALLTIMVVAATPDDERDFQTEGGG